MLGADLLLPEKYEMLVFTHFFLSLPVVLTHLILPG